MRHAILTNLLYIGWLGHRSKTFKVLKNLKSNDILRDNMTPAEMNLTLFSEFSAIKIAKSMKANFLISIELLLRKQQQLF
jgi:hypothetical protein